MTGTAYAWLTANIDERTFVWDGVTTKVDVYYAGQLVDHHDLRPAMLSSPGVPWQVISRFHAACQEYVNEHPVPGPLEEEQPTNVVPFRPR